jgi:hypothetical protein
VLCAGYPRTGNCRRRTRRARRRSVKAAQRPASLRRRDSRTYWPLRRRTPLVNILERRERDSNPRPGARTPDTRVTFGRNKPDSAISPVSLTASGPSFVVGPFAFFAHLLSIFFPSLPVFVSPRQYTVMSLRCQRLRNPHHENRFIAPFFHISAALDPSGNKKRDPKNPDLPDSVRPRWRRSSLGFFVAQET